MEITTKESESIRKDRWRNAFDGTLENIRKRIARMHLGSKIHIVVRYHLKDDMNNLLAKKDFLVEYLSIRKIPRIQWFLQGEKASTQDILCSIGNKYIPEEESASASKKKIILECRVYDAKTLAIIKDEFENFDKILETHVLEPRIHKMEFEKWFLDTESGTQGMLSLADKK